MRVAGAGPAAIFWDRRGRGSGSSVRGASYQLGGNRFAVLADDAAEEIAAVCVEHQKAVDLRSDLQAIDKILAELGGSGGNA